MNTPADLLTTGDAGNIETALRSEGAARDIVQSYGHGIAIKRSTALARTILPRTIFTRDKITVINHQEYSA